MMKWKNTTQKTNAGVLEHRKSIQLRTPFTKKFSNEGPSYKGYLNRRAITQPEQPIEQNRSSFVPKNDNYKRSYLNKVRNTEKLEFSNPYMSKKSQKFFKSGQKNSHENLFSNSINRNSYNQYSFNEQQWQNRIHSNMIPSTNTQARWKKTRLKQEQTYQKLKQIQNLIKSRKQTNRQFDNDNFTNQSQNEEMKKNEEKQNTMKINQDQQQIYPLEIKSRKSETGQRLIPRKVNNIIKQSRNSAAMNKKIDSTQIEKQEEIDKDHLVTLNKIGAGTFGQVFTVKDSSNGKLYAVKKIYNDKSHKNRQIQIMEAVDSKFVIKKLKNYSIVTENEGEEKQYIFIVMPKFQSNLYEYFRNTYYGMCKDLFKIYLYQIFRGVLHLHSRGICHRDLKPQNILIKENRVVICDLGSAKILSPSQQNISYICSRCYRAPELIFGNTKYSVSIDIWSVGCIILQFLNRSPLFLGKDSLHHLVEVIKVLGTPTKNQILSMNPQYDCESFKMPKIKPKRWSVIFPDINRSLQDLLDQIMLYSPSKRITAKEVLFHPYFHEIREQQFMKKMSIKHNLELSHFFQFDQKQKQLIKNYEKLIPNWL